jgi:hypothetical protein
LGRRNLGVKVSVGWDYAFVGVKITPGNGALSGHIVFIRRIFGLVLDSSHFLGKSKRYLPLGCGKKMDIGFSWRPGLVLDKKTYLE